MVKEILDRLEKDKRLPEMGQIREKQKMNNETFGMTFQYAICLLFKIENDISISRIDKGLLKSFIESKIINKIFKGKAKPIEYLSNTIFESANVSL